MLPYIHHLLPGEPFMRVLSSFVHSRHGHPVNSSVDLASAAIMTCLVARQIGTGDKHWAIRDKVRVRWESHICNNTSKAAFHTCYLPRTLLLKIVEGP